jgi:parallel beta-helix repeat protein
MKPLLLAVLVLFVSALPVSLVAGTIYVDCDNTTGPWDGSPAHPLQHIQDALDIADPGDTVLVAEGTYAGPRNRDLGIGEAITVQSESGPAVTIIDCEGRYDDPHRGFMFWAGATPASVLDGFTIRNGHVIRDATHADSYGGGIWVYQASPTIKNCVIRNCTAVRGGGISCQDGSSPTIENCTIADNTTTSDNGGGIDCFMSSSPTIVNCTITGNTSAAHGGGICCESHCDAQITGCTIASNSALENGGGVNSTSSSHAIINDCAIAANSGRGWGYGGGGVYVEDLTMTNCIVARNRTEGGGGGIYCIGGTITICTIKGNTATGTWGGGIRMATLGTVTDCIVWGNSDAGGQPQISAIFGSVFYSCVQDEDPDDGNIYPGVGNIDDDPLFVSGPLHDYYLSQVAAGQGADSPCVDTGSDTAANLGLDTLTTRTDGVPDEGVVDMGYHAPPARVVPVAIARLEDDSIRLEWDSETGKTYHVFLGHSLPPRHVEPFWFLVATIPGTGGAMTWNDAGGAEWWWPHPADPSLKQRFYRVVEQDSLVSPVLQPDPGGEEPESANAVSETESPLGGPAKAGNVRHGSGNVRRRYPPICGNEHP